MGFANFEKLSLSQLTKHIRKTSQATESVFITKHARVQMKKRKINASLVYECLREGAVRRVPEPNLRLNTLECRMERYAACSNCCVVAALCDEDPDVVCVTVFFSN